MKTRKATSFVTAAAEETLYAICCDIGREICENCTKANLDFFHKKYIKGIDIF